MLLITQLMKETSNNDSESSKLNVDLFHAVNQVYFAQEEQVQRNRLCSSRTKVFQLKKKRFVRENHNLLTNNEEVVNGTDSLITWERRGEPKRATLRGKKWVNDFYDHRFYVTLAIHGTLYWNFLFFFLNEKGDLLLIIITLDNLSAPDLREQSGAEVLKVEFQSSARDYPPVSPIKQTLRKTFVGLWGVAVTRGNLPQVHQLISFQRKYIESRQILSSLIVSKSRLLMCFLFQK